MFLLGLCVRLILGRMVRFSDLLFFGPKPLDGILEPLYIIWEVRTPKSLWALCPEAAGRSLASFFVCLQHPAIIQRGISFAQKHIVWLTRNAPPAASAHIADPVFRLFGEIRPQFVVALFWACVKSAMGRGCFGFVLWTRPDPKPTVTAQNGEAQPRPRRSVRKAA